MRVTPVENGNRIELPADWTAELGLEKFAALEKTADGILVHSCPALSWDEIFAKKLPIGSQSSLPEAIEVTGDAVIL